ncbi:MAG: hypothetical protein L3J11_12005 [Draconibacterium sp.]|nr:hypothetical protein [Draconibacterium sp.]
MEDDKIINFDGLLFLNELENRFKSKNINGVIELAKNRFPIGNNIKMNNSWGDEPIFVIERVSISHIYTREILLDIGDINADSVIRSLNLSYLDNPFQIDLYGSLVDYSIKSTLD